VPNVHAGAALAVQVFIALLALEFAARHWRREWRRRIACSPSIIHCDQLGLDGGLLTPGRQEPKSEGSYLAVVPSGSLGIARGLWEGLGFCQVACLVFCSCVLFVVIRLVFGRAVYSEMMGHLSTTGSDGLDVE